MSRMPIPDDWDGLDYCCTIIEWPNSPHWRAIFVGLLTQPTRGWFWDERTGSVIEAQAIGEQIELRNFSEECTMGCLEDLTNVITQLGITISNTVLNAGGCGCSGTGGAGIYEQEQSTFTDTGDNFPDGYPDRGEYELAKCRLARYILDRWSADLSRIRTVNAAGQSAQALAAILAVLALTPIPFTQLTLLAAAILGLASLGIAVLVEAIDELITWINAVDICLLYSAADAGIAKQNILDNLDEQTFTQDTLAKNLFSYLVNFDAINIIFQDNPTINVDSLPTADCSECATPACYQGYSISLGTGPSYPTNGGTFESQAHLGYQYLQVTSFPVGQDFLFQGINDHVDQTPLTGDQYRFRSHDADPGEYDLWMSDSPPADDTVFENLESFIISGDVSSMFGVNFGCAP